MGRILFALALAGGIGQGALAADTAAARLAAARSYVELPVVRESIEAALGIEQIEAAIDADLIRHGVPAADRAKMKNIVGEAMTEIRPKLIERSVAAMVKVYTVSDIETMIAFVQTPRGASVQRKSAAYAAAFMKDVLPFAQAMQRSVETRVRRAFR